MTWTITVTPLDAPYWIIWLITFIWAEVAPGGMAS